MFAVSFLLLRQYAKNMVHHILDLFYSVVIEFALWNIL